MSPYAPNPCPPPPRPAAATGIVGTSISNGLLTLRQKLDPTYIPQVGCIQGVAGGAGGGG